MRTAWRGPAAARPSPAVVILIARVTRAVAWDAARFAVRVHRQLFAGVAIKLGNTGLDGLADALASKTAAAHHGLGDDGHIGDLDAETRGIRGIDGRR